MRKLSPAGLKCWGSGQLEASTAVGGTLVVVFAVWKANRRECVRPSVASLYTEPGEVMNIVLRCMAPGYSSKLEVMCVASN